MGVESFISDVASTAVGGVAAASFFEGGPLAAGAFVIGSVATNEVLNNTWDIFNENNFPKLGLGDYYPLP